MECFFGFFWGGFPPRMESDLSSVKGLRFKGEHNLNILALSEKLGRFHCVN